ncbi:LLM class flavin-dependent oxidoreductase [Cellulomonas sp. McL0617]|uniref:LLM class flavin-dependent oxidoreductase n=1 Tax=Cellulomonas sp. McL0617 TaxID=3415675 RepID=UPI003CE946B8
MSTHAHLGVDLSDTGARAAAWRTHGSQGQRLFDAGRLEELVAVAQRGALDFVVFDDDFALHPGGSTNRLDAALVAARLAPRTHGIGIVAAVGTTHTAPAHISTAIATIDQASGGRAGWQVAWSTRLDEVPTAGPRSTSAQTAAVQGASAAAATVGRLWDRPDELPVARPRFTTHDGVNFAAGKTKTSARPTTGRPPVVVRATTPAEIELAGRHADVIRIRATSRDEAAQTRARVLGAVVAAGRDPRDVRVLVDVYLIVGPDSASAQARLDMLTDLEGVSWDTGSLAFVGTSTGFAELVTDWLDAEAADGFTIRPASVQTDLVALVEGVLPVLRASDAFRSEYPGTTFRDTLGLQVPAHRFAATA